MTPSLASSRLICEASFDASQSEGVQGDVLFPALCHHHGSERRWQLHRDGGPGLIKVGFRQHVLDILEDRETALFAETTCIAGVAHYLPFVAFARMPVAVISVLAFDLVDCKEDSVVGPIKRASNRLTTAVVLGIFGNESGVVGVIGPTIDDALHFGDLPDLVWRPPEHQVLFKMKLIDGLLEVAKKGEPATFFLRGS
jgi:hypothetical protein